MTSDESKPAAIPAKCFDHKRLHYMCRKRSGLLDCNLPFAPRWVRQEELPDQPSGRIIYARMRHLGLTAIACLCLALLASVASARTATGWSHGRKKQIKLVHVSGVELEAKAARAFREMARAARKAGIQLEIRSGFRSHEAQKALYARFRRGWGNLAARPGYSNHQSGKAVDIYIDDYKVYEWLRKHANKYGFKRTVRREAWHWEYVKG